MLKKLFPLSVLPNKMSKKISSDIFRKEFIVRKIYDRPMILPIQIPGIGHSLAVFRERELDQREILVENLKPGETVLDIGSNMGYYALIELSAVGNCGKIYAFEPNPRIIETLRRNIDLNSASNIVEIFQEAVSNFDGFATFHIAKEANLSAMHISRGKDSPDLIKRGLSVRDYVAEIKVRTRDLCTLLCSTDRPIDMIRMDIEGHEVEILQALLHGLRDGMLNDRAPKKILFEPHSWEYRGQPNSMHSILSELGTFGYRVAMLGTRSEPDSPIAQRGYRSFKELREKRGVTRGVYRDIAQADAIELASSVDGVTTVFLDRILQQD